MASLSAVYWTTSWPFARSMATSASRQPVLAAGLLVEVVDDEDLHRAGPPVVALCRAERKRARAASLPLGSTAADISPFVRGRRVRRKLAHQPQRILQPPPLAGRVQLPRVAPQVEHAAAADGPRQQPAGQRQPVGRAAVQQRTATGCGRRPAGPGCGHTPPKPCGCAWTVVGISIRPAVGRGKSSDSSSTVRTPLKPAARIISRCRRANLPLGGQNIGHGRPVRSSSQAFDSAISCRARSSVASVRTTWLTRVPADLERAGQVADLGRGHRRRLGRPRDVEGAPQTVLGEQVRDAEVRRVAVVPARRDVASCHRSYGTHGTYSCPSTSGLPPVDRHRRQADAEDRPEPDAAHRPFDEDVEAGVDHERDPVGEQEQEQRRPVLAARAGGCAGTPRARSPPTTVAPAPTRLARERPPGPASSGGRCAGSAATGPPRPGSRRRRRG